MRGMGEGGARNGNSNLHDSSRNKQDEFYTNLQLIEDELKHYRVHFKGKRVLCNCDDPYESNFFKCFAMNFNALGLRSLTATCYATSPVVYTQLDLFGQGMIVSRKESKGRKDWTWWICRVAALRQGADQTGAGQGGCKGEHGTVAALLVDGQGYCREAS